jgi:GrpB-like predicted nucleotidyltransferase (UPF0157 family)
MSHRAPIQIEPYSPLWPQRFEAARRRLLDALPGPVVGPVQVEHIGSTAVPGLAAKPIVDVMLAAASIEALDRCVPLIQALGYDYRPEHESSFPRRRFLALPRTRPRSIHLHAVVRDEPFWCGHLQFRDALRADAALAARYAALKLALAQRHGDDREAYTEAKGPFIRAVLAAFRR